LENSTRPGQTVENNDNVKGIIVIYIRVQEVNFPARQLISATMAQPTFVLDFSADQNIDFFFKIKTNFIVEFDIVNKESNAVESIP
jgi:hypothetical protein